MQKIDQLKLYDIYPTWHLPFWQTTWFYGTMILLGILLVVALTMWAIRRYRQRKQAEEPWQIALTQLNALQKNQYTTKAASKQCYFAITSILKQYLHTQHQVPAIGKTDEELIKFLQKSNLIAHPIIGHLATICNGCLYIKFANQDAIQQQIREHLALSIQIIQDTKPKQSTRTS